MVHRQQWETSWGAKKFNFLIRDIDSLAMAAARCNPVNIVVLRSPGGRLGSVLDVRNRLRRVRGGFRQYIHISTGPQQCAEQYHDPQKFSIQSSLESPKHRRMRCRRLPDPRPNPEGAREPICIRKK